MGGRFFRDVAPVVTGNFVVAIWIVWSILCGVIGFWAGRL